MFGSARNNAITCCCLLDDSHNDQRSNLVISRVKVKLNLVCAVHLGGTNQTFGLSLECASPTKTGWRKSPSSVRSDQRERSTSCTRQAQI